MVCLFVYAIVVSWRNDSQYVKWNKGQSPTCTAVKFRSFYYPLWQQRMLAQRGQNYEHVHIIPITQISFSYVQISVSIQIRRSWEKIVKVEYKFVEVELKFVEVEFKIRRSGVQIRRSRVRIRRSRVEIRRSGSWNSSKSTNKSSKSNAKTFLRPVW
jgi:hypothetical protein